MAESLPLVRVVVLNYDGGQMTIDCLQSLLASDWPAERLEIVLVDNGSLDDVAERVRDELPSVRVIEPFANTGFARGCNLGIEAPGHYDLLALVNNDAVVDPGWLSPLAEALETEGTGAVSPKMLFDGRYLEVALEVPDASPMGIDGRTLGVRCTAFRIDGHRADERIKFDEGFFLPETPHPLSGEEMAVWSWRTGRVRVRLDDGAPPSTLSMRVSCAQPRTLRIGERTVAVGPVPAWIDIDLPDQPIDVINNAGSALYAGGYGGDRGFLESDRGQYDEPADVFAWCGGAVLMRGEYLADVGTFDERLFLYYEDTDLSWRGRLRGWNYRYVPTSVVRHRHAQSSGQWSPVFRFYTERNRPLVLAKNAPPGLAWSAGTQLARHNVRQLVRCVLVPPLRLRMPMGAEGLHHWRILFSYLRLLPPMLRDRWSASPTADRRSLLRWVQTKEIAS